MSPCLARLWWLFCAAVSTIARVLTASNTELVGGIKQVISDEIVSEESEGEALALLGEILAAEVQQTTESADALRLALERSSAVSAQQKPNQQRQGLLLSLTEARAAVFAGAQQAISSCQA